MGGANASDTTTYIEKDKALYDKARSLWLSPSSEKDLEEVETILRRIWEGETNYTQEAQSPQKRSKCEIDPCSVKGQAGSRLALWLIQRSRTSAEADQILQRLSYECRLSTKLLIGDKNQEKEPEKLPRGLVSNIPCRIYDRFLSDNDLQHLRSVFGDIESTYWTDHNYSVEPPSPYYSYLIPLKELDQYGFLGSLIERLRQCLMEWQPLLRTCTYCEMWAHNRPSATGHQLHFDTDNEGCEGATRHPLVTCVLYLTGVGGPTLVTNQRKASRHAADKGWISHAQVGRMTALDGRVLHCVVPGRPTLDPQRRVSLMLAFWRRIKVRDEPTHGAARKFPAERPWARALKEPTLQSTFPETWSCNDDQVDPESINHVFEDLNGDPWPITSGLPSYDCVFQGI